MSNIAKRLGIVRLVKLSVVSVFSLVVLAVNAHYIWTTTNTQLSVDRVPVWPQSAPDVFSALNLAVAVITIVTVPTMIVVDLVRKGAVTSMIAVEFGWLGFLNIMWLASAAYTTSIWPPLGALCSLNPNIPNLDGACVDVQTSMAFGWLSWISLTAYLVLLLVFCIMSANRGNPVWTSTIKTANWASGKGYSAPPMQHQMQPSTGYGAPHVQYQTPAPAGYTATQYDPPTQSAQYGYGGGAEV